MQSNKHIFVATHPRACSTAFERVFMTCHESLSCVHEPFGEAWYFGPERLSPRFDGDKAETERERSGHGHVTYRDVFENMESQAANSGKRLFIKDMAQYLMVPGGPGHSSAGTTASSLVDFHRGVGTNGDDHIASGVNNTHKTSGVSGNGNGAPIPNPTVLPSTLLSRYHFAFLIRHPRSSVPSYYRCTIPPLSKLTQFHNFDPAEAGYRELRILFDYLRASHDIGKGSNVPVCVIDADDLLDSPHSVIEAFCKSTGVKYTPDMLNWDDEVTQNTAREAFEKWKGFHEDALDSKGLKPRTHKKALKTDEQLLSEWTEKYGQDAAQVMMKTANDNVEDYEYLKQFAIKV